KALEGNDTDSIRMATEHAAQVSQKMGSAIYAQSQASSAQQGEPGGHDDDVVEAEIVDDDKEGGAA
ncbi:MAG: molecular chaperone DnaK, partial [Actinobacteria bacterium]|nr:molecular chaperone DnaK [Actinomycetota bacterium]